MPAASTHTATYETATARVRINLSGFAVGTTGIQVVRRDLTTGVSALVRGARLVPIVTPLADTVQLYDYEWTPGHSTRYDYYQFPSTTAYQVASAVTRDLTRPRIQHVTRPNLVLEPVVASFDGPEHTLRTTVTPAVRTAIPLGTSDVRGGRSWPITLKADTVDEQAAVENLLAAGGVWLLQVPSTGWAGLPAVRYVMPTDARQRFAGRLHDNARRYDLTVAEVQAPAADIATSAITWNDVTATYATWGDLVAAVATWNDLLAQVAEPSEVVV